MFLCHLIPAWIRSRDSTRVGLCQCRRRFQWMVVLMGENRKDRNVVKCPNQ